MPWSCARTRLLSGIVPLCLAAPSLGQGAAGQTVLVMELEKLASPAPEDGAFFGSSVGISGAFALVGTRREDHVPGSGQDEGVAYVFEEGRGEPVVLLASDAQPDADFGFSVAIHGDTALVSAPAEDEVPAAAPGAPAALLDVGAVYVFARVGGGWEQVAKLGSSDPEQLDGFGVSVAVDGSTAVVGVPIDSHVNGSGAQEGAAYVFEDGASRWAQVAMLTALDAEPRDSFGFSVSVSGDSIAVGAPLDDNDGGDDAGSVYVFQRDQGGVGAWGQVARLVAFDGAQLDLFGNSVAIHGGLVAVGAPTDKHAEGLSGGIGGQGSAYLFERDPAGAWSVIKKLTAFDAQKSDRFGESVSVADPLVVVGANGDDHEGGAGSGSAYAFSRHQGGPGAFGLAAKLVASDAAPNDGFGVAVACSGSRALVGALVDDFGPWTDAGSAYVHALPVSGQTYCTAGTSASGCQALLSATGTASATAPTGFLLDAAGVEGAKDGLFFFGTSGRQANPWGNGTSYQCVVPPVTRAGLLDGVGTSGQCDGGFGQDLNAHWTAKPSHNPGAGALVQAQLWYRDPQNTSNQTTSLSDALEFTVAP